MGRQRSRRRQAAQGTPPQAPPAPELPLRSGSTVAVPLAAGLAVLCAYLLTLGTTVSHGDSGELIAVCHTLGVAHPPGYPLYTLLGKLFTTLPLGTIAWRVNLLSAVCGAGAAFFVARAAARITTSSGAALLAAGLFAFSPTVWPYAVTAEVFALNNLFVAVLLDLTTRRSAEAGGQRRLLLLACFVFGLGLANHHTLLLLAGPVLAWRLFRDRSALGGRRGGLALALAFAAGLLPYLYLAIAPALGSEIVWGDTATLDGFVGHILRRDYGTLQLATGVATPAGGVAERLRALVQALASGSFGLGPLLVVASLPALCRPSPARGALRAWTAALVGSVVLFASLANLSPADPIHAAVLSRFWQQAVLVLAFLAGLGLAELGRLLPETSARRALAAAGTLVFAVLCAAGFRAADQRGRSTFRDYGRAILEPLPANSILAVASDEAIGAVRYLQQVEGLRRDVRVLPAGQIATPWFRKLAATRMPELRLPAESDFSFRSFVDLNLPRGRVFLVNRVPWEQTLEEAYSPWTSGLADEVRPKQQPPSLEAWVEQASRSFALYDARAELGTDGAWERYVEAARRRQVERFAIALGTAAAASGGSPAVARQVIRGLEPLASEPSPVPIVLRNLGVAHQFASSEPAARSRMAAAFRRYLDLAPDAPDRDVITKAIAQAERATAAQPASLQR